MSDTSQTRATAAKASTECFGCADIRRYIGPEGDGRSSNERNTNSVPHPLGLPNEHHLRECLTRALADLLWHEHGGPDVVNWLEAERFVDHMLDSCNPRHGR